MILVSVENATSLCFVVDIDSLLQYQHCVSFFLLCDIISDLFIPAGRILTLKSTCFICEEHDYGKKWQALNEDQVCQDVMFEVCFRNFTKQRRSTTKVASIVRRCDLDDCECNNVRQQTRDWHVVPNCATSVVCCDEKYLTCSKSYNFWFYTYFWTS